jgi:5-methylcytosine-specific restriction endonuclease McrA
MEYKDQLLTSEWKAKRKEILDRDNNECQMCMSNKLLHIHHKRYITGHMAWEYDDTFLITVCESCHNKHHQYKYKTKTHIGKKKTIDSKGKTHYHKIKCSNSKK